jgi:hypothetical protein
MRRGPLLARMLCSVVVIGWGTLRLATAGDELGHFCWRLEPYVDTVRLSVSVSTDDVQMFHVLASWRAGPAPANWTIGGPPNDTRPTQYDLLGTGVARASFYPNDPSSIFIKFMMLPTSGYFPSFSGEICFFDMQILMPSLNAVYGVRCPPNGPKTAWLTPIPLHPCGGNE